MSSGLYTRLILIFAITIQGLWISSQTVNYRQYTVKDGLPTNYVYGVVEGGDGTIWVYTENGISRFDGHQFHNYSTEDGLFNNDVYHMVRDSCDRIWMSGIGKGVAYIDSGEKEIRQLDVADNILTLYGSIHLRKDYFKHYSFDSCFDKNNLVWEDNYGHVQRTKSKEGEWTHGYKEPLLYTRAADTTIVLPTLEHGPIFGKGKQRNFFVFNLSNKTLFIDEDMAYMTSHMVTEDENPYQSITRGAKGQHVYDTPSSAYLIQEPELKLIPIVSTENFTQDFIKLRCYIDSKDNLWIGSVNSGLFFISNLSRKTYNYPIPRKGSNNLERIIEYNGKLLVISDDFIVYEIVQNTLLESENFKGNRFESATRIRNGLILFGGVTPIEYNFSIRDYTRSAQGKVPPDLETNLTLRSAKEACFSTSGDSLVYTSSSGVFYFIKHTDTFVFRREHVNNLTYFQNSFWGSAGKTLYRITVDSLIPVMEFSNQVTLLYPHKDNSLWVATSHDGLYSYKSTTHTASKIGDINYVTSIKHDSTDYFFGSKNGLHKTRLISDSLEITYSYTEKDGLISHEVADIHLTDTFVYVASNQGFSRIDRTTLVLPDTAMDISIQDVSVNEVSASLDSLLNLNFDQNNISISFLMKDYQSEGNIQYNYQLHPIINTWQTTKERRVLFSDLSPGSYSFLIRAVGSTGSRSKKESISFTIRSPFWKTWWFYLGVFIISMITALKTVQWYYKKREKDLENKKAIDKKIATLKAESLKAQMNPHFIFNTLGSIQYYIQRKNVKEADAYLSKFAKLIRQYLHNATESWVGIDEDISMLEDYIALERMRFDFSFNCEITIDPRIEVDQVELPSLITQPFVENAIIHGLQSRKDGKGLLHIHYEQRDNDIYVIIEDNGIGVEESLSYKKSSRYSTSKGNKDRIEALNQIGVAEVEYKVENQNDTTPFPGTKITLVFKNIVA